MTLQEAIEWLRAQLNSGKGVNCPCCKRFLKVYKRKLNSAMARCLIQFYRYDMSKDGQEFHHVSDIFKGTGDLARLGGGGDFAKLRFWGLIEEEAKDPKADSRTSGRWRLTDKGKRFVCHEEAVSMHAYFFKGVPYKWEDDMATIVDCLGEHFSYFELMGFDRATGQREMWA